MRQRREVHQPQRRGQRVRHGFDPLVIGVGDLAGAAHRPQQRAGVRLLQGDQLELDRGHDHAGAAAAAQRPVEVRLPVVVDVAPLAFGGDDLEGAHVVGREAVAAREPPEPAADQVAGDPQPRPRSPAGR
jgi:hypothetical protein